MEDDNSIGGGGGRRGGGENPQVERTMRMREKQSYRLRKGCCKSLGFYFNFHGKAHKIDIYI